MTGLKWETLDRQPSEWEALLESMTACPECSIGMEGSEWIMSSLGGTPIDHILSEL